MKQWLPRLVILTLVLSGLVVGWSQFKVMALDPVAELQQEIDELSKLRKLSEEATKPLEAELATIQQRIKNVNYQLNLADQETVRLEQDIEEREEDLSEQYAYLAVRVRSYYKTSQQSSPILTMLSSASASDVTRALTYRSAVVGQDKAAIMQTTESLLGLEKDKDALEQRKVQLAGLRTQFEKDAEFFSGEIEGAKAYQEELSEKIAELSAKQQAIINARSGTAVTSVGSVPIKGDFDATLAGFQQKAPGGSFAVFSFGAYTHRKGMSQYGAQARAEAGQSYKEILKKYYGKEPVSKDTGGDIQVDGHGAMNFEDVYLLGIAEMPSNWHVEALKAQAVAARTYAYRYKSEGKSICTTEACQVFLKSKADNAPENWKKAVEDTKGQVLEDVVTFYSSTTGGYITTSGWDTTDGSGDGDWASRAWESKANSPWFYKAWYRQSYSDSSSDCGRKPWLSQAEMADILNAHIVRHNSGDQGVVERILPVTINSCSIGGQSGNPLSLDELKSEANKHGGAVTSISGVTVRHNGSGVTASVSFSTNRGSIEMSGAEFKEAFNTRAPGYLRIPQSGFAFFNIESK